MISKRQGAQTSVSILESLDTLVCATLHVCCVALPGIERITDTDGEIGVLDQF